MTLYFTLPRPNGGQQFALSRSELREWLAALPAGNAAEAARCLVQQLSAMNRTAMPARARIDFAELFREKIDTLLPALEADLARATLPLSGRRREAAAVTDELLVELGYAYKSGVVAMSKPWIGFGGRSRLQAALLHAMHALARRLASGYRIYAANPKMIWQELHVLYQLAVKHGLTEIRLPGTVDTPSSVYRQALLLAFAVPHKLMQGDIDRILDYLARFSDRTRLVPPSPDTEGPGAFLIQPHRDAPGSAIAKFRLAASRPNDLVLNCLPLVEVLLDHIDKLEDGVSAGEIGLPAGADAPIFRDLLQRLARHWGNVATRQFGRLRTHARVELRVGLRAIWHSLTREGRLEGPGATSSTWMVTNESPGGYALMHVSGRCEPIRVGEVVAVYTGETCHICVVRWVLSDNPEHLELGVQEFAPSATPIGLEGENASESEPALLLPEIPALRQPSAILAPYGQVDASRELLIAGDNARLRVRATRIVEQTLSVQMFQFSPARG